MIIDSLHKRQDSRAFSCAKDLLTLCLAGLFATELALLAYDSFVPGHGILLEREDGFVPWLNGMILASAALCALGCFVIFVRDDGLGFSAGRRRTWLWLVLAACLAWFATDDIIALHERVGREAVTDIVHVFSHDDVVVPNTTWQALFTPVFVGAALSMAVITRRYLWHTALRRWAILGIGMLAVATLLEPIGSILLIDRGRIMSASVIIEETLEIVGATIWLAILGRFLLTRLAEPEKPTAQRPDVAQRSAPRFAAAGEANGQAQTIRTGRLQ